MSDLPIFQLIFFAVATFISYKMLSQAKKTDVPYNKEKAEAGDAEAQYRLGIVYYQALNVPQDFSAVIQWLHKAAEQNHAAAQALLGFIYDEGRGVTQDYAEAAQWYRKAADKDNEEAKTGLERIYNSGKGVS